MLLTMQARIYEVFLKFSKGDRHELLTRALEAGDFSERTVADLWNEDWLPDRIPACSLAHARRVVEDLHPNILDFVVVRTRKIEPVTHLVEATNS